MISFNSNNALEKTFQFIKLCLNIKKEKDLVKLKADEILNKIDKDILDKIAFIKKIINENKTETVVTYAGFMYPECNLKESVDKLYNETKKFSEKFIENDKELNKIIKNIRCDAEYEKKLKNLGLVKHQICKMAYLKTIFDNMNKCKIINIKE